MYMVPEPGDTHIHPAKRGVFEVQVSLRSGTLWPATLTWLETDVTVTNHRQMLLAFPMEITFSQPFLLSKSISTRFLNELLIVFCYQKEEKCLWENIGNSPFRLSWLEGCVVSVLNWQQTARVMQGTRERANKLVLSHTCHGQTACTLTCYLMCCSWAAN